MPGQRDDDFNRAAHRQAARLPAILQKHVRVVVAELERAQRRIVRLLRGASTDAGRAHWMRIQREIEVQLATFRTAVAQNTTAGIEAAFAAGRELLTVPLAAAGFPQIGPEFRLNPRALTALRLSAVDRIQDLTAQALGRVRAVLSQGVIGTLRLDQVVDRINRILGGNTRRRAMTIAYTEIGRAYSIASYESMQRADALGVKVALRWQQSGKRHPRVSHVNAHNQIVRFGTMFSIVDTRTAEQELLRFPRDPNASAGNTINCGCLAVPVVDGSSFDVLDARTGEVRRHVITLPTDPNAAPELVTPEERARRNRAQLEAFNERMRGLLASGAIPGLSVTNTANASGLIRPIEPEPP